MLAMALTDRNIVVCIGGGIAAYKAIEVVRELGRRGAKVRVAMTQSAARFVGPMTLAGLTGRPPVMDLWDPSYPGEVHVELSQWADAIIVTPATQNLMARCVAGMADDVVLATLACADCPVTMAPAMHTRMWSAAANQRNVRQLEDDGARLVGPVDGALASGEQGMGRMADPADIVDAVASSLAPDDLSGRTVLVSAGPTHEDLDPVRYLSNRSTGRMGYAVARAAVERGAQVILVTGPTHLAPPPGVRCIHVRSAVQMREAVQKELPALDAVVMTAAVADFRPAELQQDKVKKQGETMTVEFVRNPDILAELGAGRTGARPALVGFAMETRDVVDYARGKLTNKKVDLIVANHASDGFGGDHNVATLVGVAGDEPLPRMSKLDLAHRIWDRVGTLLAARADS